MAASAVQRHLILADAEALWPRMIKVCDGPVVLHAVLPEQHRAAGEIRGTHGNVAAFSSSDDRLEIEGYPTHTQELHWMPACIPLAFATRVGGAPQAQQNLPALGVMCVLRMWTATCCRISFCGMYEVQALM
jgi:hypothetical protein